MRRIDTRFSDFQRRSRAGAARGACNGSSATGESCVFRHSVRGALTFGAVAAIPKNALRSVANECCAIGFARFIPVFHLFGQLLRGKDHERQEARYLSGLRHIRSGMVFRRVENC
jgi:hypothetical protein